MESWTSQSDLFSGQGDRLTSHWSSVNDHFLTPKQRLVFYHDMAPEKNNLSH